MSTIQDSSETTNKMVNSQHWIGCICHFSFCNWFFVSIRWLFNYIGFLAQLNRKWQFQTLNSFEPLASHSSRPISNWKKKKQNQDGSISFSALKCESNYYATLNANRISKCNLQSHFFYHAIKVYPIHSSK